MDTFFFVFNQASYITKGLHSREVFLNRSEPIIAGVIWQFNILAM